MHSFIPPECRARKAFTEFAILNSEMYVTEDVKRMSDWRVIDGFSPIMGSDASSTDSREILTDTTTDSNPNAADQRKADLVSDSTSILSTESAEPAPRPDITSQSDESMATDSTSMMDSDPPRVTKKQAPPTKLKRRKILVKKKRKEVNAVKERHYGLYESIPLHSEPYAVGDVSGFNVTDASPSPDVIELREEESDRTEVESALIMLLEEREIPEERLIPPVLDVLRTESVNAIVNEEYDYAEQLENATNYLREHWEMQSNANRAYEIERAVARKVQRVKGQLQAEYDAWDRVLHDFKIEQEKQRQIMLEDHVREQEEYEEKWRDPSMMMPFSKPSAQLMELRRTQKRMALAKRFNEAKQIKERADQMQIAEGLAAEKRVMVAIQAGYDALIEKQKREVECFDEHERRTIAYIELERRKATEPIERQIQALEVTHRQESEKSATMKHRKTIVWRVDESKRSPMRTAVGTPRSRQLLEYKRSRDQPRLNLNTLTLKRYVANHRAASSCKIVRLERQ